MPQQLSEDQKSRIHQFLLENDSSMEESGPEDIAEALGLSETEKAALSSEIEQCMVMFLGGSCL